MAGQGIAACRQLARARAQIRAGALLSGDESRPARAHGISRRAADSSRKWSANSRRRRIWTHILIMPARSAASACLYREAPGWPVSIGSQAQGAAICWNSAVKLAPDYPENQLNLVESYLKWDERAEPRKSELRALDALWPEAQTNLHRRGMGTKLGRLDRAPKPPRNNLTHNSHHRPKARH